MAVTAQYGSQLDVFEVLDEALNPAAPASGRSINHTAFSSVATLQGTGTVAIDRVAAFRLALTAGAATIDLTALLGTNGATVDGTGKRVQVVKFINPAANANAITLTFGATNPYLLHGTGWKVTLEPGQEHLAYLNNKAPVIGSSAKNIDVTGTGTQALLALIVMG